MKNVLQTACLLFVALFALNETTHAQIQNTWVGGMPGRPIDWNVAANWSLHRVPNEFHDVVIPNTSTTTASYPVIDETVDAHSLRIESGAKLVILETGKLNLHAIGRNMSDVLANNGEIENRSRNLVGFHDSVFGDLKETLATRTY
ncbi:MAG: hypothetical protein DYG98_06215 [Haliscomenobacteraceae bacterium CHB4]|nr:hypothetical protein [Saprospiraceae bacterium]MCE7922630.1 hypothetical protein [Haliscomenobacteraceae bacterium CHB4]